MSMKCTRRNVISSSEFQTSHLRSTVATRENVPFKVKERWPNELVADNCQFNSVCGDIATGDSARGCAECTGKAAAITEFASWHLEICRLRRFQKLRRR